MHRQQSARDCGRGGRWRRFPRLAAALGALALTLAGLLPPPANADEMPRQQSLASNVTIILAPGDWGRSDRRDIQSLLETVAAAFPAPAGWSQQPLQLRISPRGNTPRVLFERGPAGEYQIQLTARDQRWHQYAYQFSHELCHIASRFDHKVQDASGEAASGNQWFEESLCETAALYTLRRLGRNDAVQSRWASQGPLFAAYAQHLLAQPHRQLPADLPLGLWYRQHGAALGANPYLRDDNDVVAAQLLPLFEQEPQLWQSLSYLNADPASAAKPFAGYLADWDQACPAAHKTLARRTMALFELAPPAVPALP